MIKIDFLSEIFPKLFMMRQDSIYLVSEEFGKNALSIILEENNDTTFMLQHYEDHLIFYFNMVSGVAIFDVLLYDPTDVSDEFYHILFEYQFGFAPNVEDYTKIKKREWTINQIESI